MKFRIVATLIVFFVLVIAYAVFSSDNSSSDVDPTSEYAP
jgi:hypothetical protein